MLGLEGLKRFQIILQTHIKWCVHDIARCFLIHDFKEHDNSPNAILVSYHGEDLLEKGVDGGDEVAVDLGDVGLCAGELELLEVGC